MQFVFAISCYMPNSTFVYNPITFTGILTATYMPFQDSDAYKLCQQLNERQVRASVQLANQETAFSENYQFKHNFDIIVQIAFETDEQQQAALITSQSNFIITFLDMDAEIKQTLAYFSILSFKTDDCLQNITAEITTGKVIIRAQERGCDYSKTKFSTIPGSALSDADINQTVWTQMVVYDLVLKQRSGLVMNSRTNKSEVEITFDCEQQIADKAICYEMIYNATYSRLTQFKFRMSYQLASPDDHYMVIYQNVDYVFDPALVNCYSSSTYQINNEMVIMYFNPSNLCKFTSENVEIVIGITSSRDLKSAVSWGYRIPNSTFTDKTTKQTVECKLIEEREECESKMQELQKLENIFVDFTIIVKNADGTDHFEVLYLDRYQSCFSYVGLTTIFRLNAVSGEFLLTNHPLGLSTCSMITMTRQLIQISFYELLVPDGLVTQIKPQPLYEVSTRQDFSVSNKTVRIGNITDMSMIRQIVDLTTKQQLYCTVQYGDMLLPVLDYIDRTQIFNQIPIYIITIVGGLGFGTLYALTEFLIGQCRRKKAITKMRQRAKQGS